VESLAVEPSIEGRLPMLRCWESKGVQLCRLVDERGRPLGWIVQPRQWSVVGPKAGTVLLRRKLPAEFVDGGNRARRTA
jgi:hypothetical protein